MSTPGTASRLSRRMLLVSTLGVFAAGFAFDQLTKLWALSSLADGTEIELLPSVSFRLAFNPGVAFSLGAEYGAVTAFVVLIILTALTTWIARKPPSGTASPKSRSSRWWPAADGATCMTGSSARTMAP